MSAADITSFEIDEPPFEVDGVELLRGALQDLPKSLAKEPRKEPQFASHACCVASGGLCTQAFWYVLVSLHFPGQEAKQHGLLQRMALQFARLAYNLPSKKRDVFFDHFAPLLAHAVLAGLRRHSALGADASPAAQAVVAVSVYRHLVALLGGGALPHDRDREHAQHAERGPVDESSSSDPSERRREVLLASSAHRPELTSLAPSSPLAPALIPALKPVARAKPPLPPLPPNLAPFSAVKRSAAASLFEKAGGGGSAEGKRPSVYSGGGGGGGAAEGRRGTVFGGGGGGGGAADGRSAWSTLKNAHHVQAVTDVAIRSRSAGEFLGGNKSTLGLKQRHYRPHRVPVDLHRATPLVDIFRGAKPADVLARTLALSLSRSFSASGFLRAGESSRPSTALKQSSSESALVFAHPSPVKHSVAGGKSRLGGKSSYQRFAPAGVVERKLHRQSEWASIKDADAFELALVERVREQKCAEIDAKRDAHLAMPTPLLSDAALRIAQHVLDK